MGDSKATPDSHTTSVIQGDTDGGIPIFDENICEPFTITNQVCTDGSVPQTPPARAPFKRAAPAPKDSEASESIQKRPRETRDAPDIESETPLERPPLEAAPATNTGSSPNTTTDTDSTSTSVTDPFANITIQINTDTGSSPKTTSSADPKNPIRCRKSRLKKKAKEKEEHKELLECLEKQRELKAAEADLKNPGSSAARDAVSKSKPLKIKILDEPCGSFGSNNDDNIIDIVTKSELMDASQKITKAAKWRSSDEFEFKFDVQPLQPSDEKIVKTRKSVKNSREKKKAVDALKVRMTEILNAENIALEANIKQIQQSQALLAQQPPSQDQPQQQDQVEQSGASAGVQTIRVNQQQPQVIQLQPQQQQQPQPQVFQPQPQQQQQAQPHHQ